MAYITFQPSDYFNTKLYTGNASTNAITGVGFQPDWLWFKNRDDTYNHHVFDVLRGVNKQLQVDSSGAESTYATSMTSFDSDGFTLGNNNNINYNGNNHVAWCWKAGGAGSSNTDGSISSTVSASTTSGFSIVKYTSNGSDGATIGHGLSQAPEIVIFKSISSSASWAVFGYPNNSAFTADGSHVLLDSTGTISDSSTKEVSLSSSTITLVDAGGDIGASGDDYIAYCFHSVKGFSKFGSYVGNGSTNGAFIYTGFKPAFVITRRISGNTGDWQLHDNKRTPTNVSDTILFPNGSTADSQASGYAMDILSNGFKIRTDNSGKNHSGSNYIYFAFAEEPLVSSNNIPATAR